MSSKTSAAWSATSATTRTSLTTCNRRCVRGDTTSHLFCDGLASGHAQEELKQRLLRGCEAASRKGWQRGCQQLPGSCSSRSSNWCGHACPHPPLQHALLLSGTFGRMLLEPNTDFQHVSHPLSSLQPPPSYKSTTTGQSPQVQTCACGCSCCTSTWLTPHRCLPNLPKPVESTDPSDSTELSEPPQVQALRAKLTPADAASAAAHVPALPAGGGSASDTAGAGGRGPGGGAAPGVDADDTLAWLDALATEINENVEERINLQKALFELEDINVCNKYELQNIQEMLDAGWWVAILL